MEKNRYSQHDKSKKREEKRDSSLTTVREQNTHFAQKEVHRWIVKKVRMSRNNSVELHYLKILK